MSAQYFLDPDSSFPKCAIRFLFYLGRGGVIFENITAFFIQANTLKMFVVSANYCKEEKKYRIWRKNLEEWHLEAIAVFKNILKAYTLK